MIDRQRFEDYIVSLNNTGLVEIVYTVLTKEHKTMIDGSRINGIRILHHFFSVDKFIDELIKSKKIEVKEDFKEYIYFLYPNLNFCDMGKFAKDINGSNWEMLKEIIRYICKEVQISKSGLRSFYFLSNELDYDLGAFKSLVDLTRNKGYLTTIERLNDKSDLKILCLDDVQEKKFCLNYKEYINLKENLEALLELSDDNEVMKTLLNNLNDSINKIIK